jgi:putative intracellular protease/amidase
MEEQKKFAYLYAFAGMADWEYGYLAAELNTGRYFRARGSALEIRTAALGPGPVRTMGGLRILPDILLDEVEAEACSILILPGGEGWLDPGQAPAVEKARALLEAGVPVAAICGATLALAAAGILDDREHTSNDLGYLKAKCPGYGGEGRFRYEPAVLDRGLVTASGIAPLEFARCVLESLDLVSREALEGWTGLYQSHEPRYYAQLMSAIAS